MTHPRWRSGGGAREDAHEEPAEKRPVERKRTNRPVPTIRMNTTLYSAFASHAPPHVARAADQGPTRATYAPECTLLGFASTTKQGQGPRAASPLPAPPLECATPAARCSRALVARPEEERDKQEFRPYFHTNLHRPASPAAPSLKMAETPRGTLLRAFRSHAPHEWTGSCWSKFRTQIDVKTPQRVRGVRALVGTGHETRGFGSGTKPEL